MDCYGDYEDAPTDGSARTSGCVSDSAVVRGGAWNINLRYLRVAFRFRNWPWNRFHNGGFRLVQDLNP